MLARIAITTAATLFFLLPLAARAQEPWVPIVNAPTIRLATYQAIYCTPRHGGVSDACASAADRYHLLVRAGIDPAVELAFALKETELGTTGPGRAPQRNLYNIECNQWDQGTCEGPHHQRFSTYPSYEHATWAFATLLLTRGYADRGLWTVRKVLPRYAPAFENDTALYIAQVETWVQFWQRWEAQTYGTSPPTPTPTLPPTVTPIPTPTPLVSNQIRMCGQGTSDAAVTLYGAPGNESDVARVLPPGEGVTLLCEGTAVVSTTVNGTRWALVHAAGDTRYTWMEANDLEGRQTE